MSPRIRNGIWLGLTLLWGILYAIKGEGLFVAICCGVAFLLSLGLSLKDKE